MIKFLNFYFIDILTLIRSIVGPNDFIFGIGISSPMSIELPNSLKKL